MKGKVVESDLPRGFRIIAGPDGREYIVPEFMVPTLEHTFSILQAKSDIGITNASGIDPLAEAAPIYSTLGGNLHLPPEPPLTDQERLTFHAEVCGLQERLGISYQDAAHRLYLAEVAKLELAYVHRKALGVLDKRIRKSLQFIAEHHSANDRYKPEWDSGSEGDREQAEEAEAQASG